MLKLSREHFYKNHFSEINKYIMPNNSVLHITSNLSENKYNQGNYDTLVIDSTQNFETQVLNQDNKKYDFIVVTDIFEVSSDIYQFVKLFKNFLQLFFIIFNIIFIKNFSSFVLSRGVANQSCSSP